MRAHVVALVAVGAAVVAAYANSLGGDFVVDARTIILENRWIHAATPSNVGRLLTHDYWAPFATGGLYRPATTLSYLLNYAVLGNRARPFGYHATNLALHLACVVLVYALAWEVTRRRVAATVAAAVFGLHPVTTEAVTYIVGRADVLASLGVLAGLLCYIHGGASRRTLWFVGLGVAALVAVLGKETGIVLLAVMLAYDLSIRRARPLSAGYLVVGCVIGIYLAARWAVAMGGLPPPDVSPVDNPLVEGSFWTARMTALGVLGRELALLVFPATLTADYSYRQIPLVTFPPRDVGDWMPLATVVVVVLAGWVAWRTRSRMPGVAFFVLVYLLAILPASNLVFLIGTIMGERLLYLPLVGFAGVVALLVDVGASRRPAMVLSAVAMLLLAFGYRTWVRNRDWVDELRLWTSAVRASPDSAKTRKAHAAALYAADARHAELGRVIAEAERAVAIRPDYLDALTDLGSYHVARGDTAASPTDRQLSYAKAAEVLERARMLDVAVTKRFREKMEARGVGVDTLPDTGSPGLYNNLALAYERLGNLDAALIGYARVRVLEPLNASRYVDLSAVLCRLGRWEECAVILFEALAISPDNRDAAARLVEVYRTFDPGGTTIVNDGHGARVRLDDAVVRTHRCRAARELTAILTKARQTAAAAGARRWEEESCERRG